MEKKLLQAVGISPTFELSHGSCAHIRRAPKILLKVVTPTSQCKASYVFDDIEQAVSFWNANRHNLAQL